jgi:hypothetical protein
MKNIKNTVAAFGLTAVLAFGTVSANAGLLISDRTSAGTEVCTVKDTGILGDIIGIVMAAISSRDGIIIAYRGQTSCETAGKGGLLISD